MHRLSFATAAAITATATVAVLVGAAPSASAVEGWTTIGSDVARPLDESQGLAESEANNNSFAAVSPDTRWLVSGEWGTMQRLLVMPMPGVAATDPDANLPLASRITLDRPVRDVQGCDFETETRLVCSSDDPDGALFDVTKPLLQIELSAPVGGDDVTGTVSSLGQLPLDSGCDGDFETEGIDYDDADGTLRVVVLSPSVCVATDSKTWRLRRS